MLPGLSDITNGTEIFIDGVMRHPSTSLKPSSRGVLGVFSTQKSIVDGFTRQYPGEDARNPLPLGTTARRYFQNVPLL